MRFAQSFPFITRASARGARLFVGCVVLAIIGVLPLSGAPNHGGNGTSTSGEAKEQTRISEILDSGKSLLGLRYRSVIDGNVLDCSGFVRHIFGQHGISLPRGSANISQVTDPIRLNEVVPGDLLFFTGSDVHSSRIGHVAIVLCNEAGEIEMMHSCNQGIVIEPFTGNQYYQKRFKGASRLRLQEASSTISVDVPHAGGESSMLPSAE